MYPHMRCRIWGYLDTYGRCTLLCSVFLWISNYVKNLWCLLSDAVMYVKYREGPVCMEKLDWKYQLNKTGWGRGFPGLFFIVNGL